MIIIDFDDTLFNTQAFKQARLEAIQRLGISEQEYWDTYRQARNRADGVITYTNTRHAEVLAAHGYDYGEVLAMLKETTGETLKNFLFEDTISFLKQIKELGQPMILLSLGNRGFQELKTKGPGIDRYFDRIIFIHDTKMNVLGELLAKVSDRDIWFINDKIEETQRLIKAFSRLKPILKISEQAKIADYKESGLSYFGNLSEIKNYILKILNS